jgi:hypothetical protein
MSPDKAVMRLLLLTKQVEETKQCKGFLFGVFWMNLECRSR